jgi:acetyltransferase-like isoleucine patch superfamily enzyme
MQNQLRQHLKFTLLNRWRARHNKLNGVKLGTNVFIEKNVQLMRYPDKISIGNDVVIKEGARICACNSKAGIIIGHNTSIGYHSFIFSSANISIGNDCLIAPFVYIVDSDHEIAKDRLINEQPNISDPIKIGNDVWIASNVTILKGVTIADGAVIAANSVVNSNVGAYEVFGGTPAKKISERI